MKRINNQPTHTHTLYLSTLATKRKGGTQHGGVLRHLPEKEKIYLMFTRIVDGSNSLLLQISILGVAKSLSHSHLPLTSLKKQQCRLPLVDFTSRFFPMDSSSSSLVTITDSI